MATGDSEETFRESGMDEELAGRRLHEGNREERQKIFSEQIYKLRLFHIILAYLEVSEEVDAERGGTPDLNNALVIGARAVITF